MKFECARNELIEALSNVSRAVSPKSTMKVIEGILFNVDEKGVYLCAYNLDMSISKTIEADIYENGSLVMPLRLYDIVRRLPGERVLIDCRDLRVHIESGSTAFDIEGLPAKEFPELPVIDSEFTVEIPQNKLRSMIAQTAHAISTKQDKPIYTGAMFEVYPDSLHMVTLDGYRVAIRIEPTRNSGSFVFIVPGKTLNEIGKMTADNENIAEIEIGKHNIYFCVDGYNIISRLMQGKFVNYSSFIHEGGKCVRVKTSDLLAGVERMSLVISEANRSPVRCVFGNNRIRLSCETPVGRAEDEIPCEADFDDIVVGFNNKYLVDSFKAVDTDEIRLLVENGKMPVQVLPPDGNHFLFLLLPIMLNENVNR